MSAYQEWVSADNEWQAELERVYKGKAGDARYDNRGVATPELRRLKEIFTEKGKAYEPSRRAPE